jgi:hypothetical protein
MYILKLCSVIVMVTPVTIEDKFQEDGDLIYAGEYLDIAGTPKSDYTKRLRVRRLICRVCKLKFRPVKKLKTISDVSIEENRLVRSIGRNIGDIIISEKIGEIDHAISSFGVFF